MTQLEELRALLGPEAVSDAPDELAAHSQDWSPAALLSLRSGRPPAPPLCVAHPGSTEEVAELLRWANATRTPVVPFGGGSGVCGGISCGGAVVLDTGGLDRIGEIDAASRLVTVGAGVRGPRLAGHLEGAGFTLGHEPQSAAVSTVGGWLATRACGQLSARYGGIEDLVRGLEAVLPGGRIVRSKPAPRRSTGPDVAALMIGSEGALGVVTEATLRISESPRPRTDLCVGFVHMAEGARACRAIVQSELRPTLVRLYDREDSMILLRSFENAPAGCVLLLSFEGIDAERRAAEALALTQGEERDRAYVEHWWAHRNDAVAEFRSIMAGEGVLGPHGVVDTMEVAATWSRLRNLYHSLKEALSAEADLAGCHLSHAYPDGACLYFTMAAACDSDEQARARLERWWDIGMRACLDGGGTISHHHGIGRLRARWLPEELGGFYDVLVAVKGAIDPHGIMNPGALGL